MVKTFLDALMEAIRSAGRYDPNDQDPPVVILWTDKDRQWEPLVPILRDRLPLLTFGPYKAAERTGPAYWLRCMIARTLPDVLPKDEIPILYLPGVSEQEIRDIEQTPRQIQPLFELQYRGVVWTNGRSDWTIADFLQSASGGLGIEIDAHVATETALRQALLKLIDEPVTHLKEEAPLCAAFFKALE